MSKTENDNFVVIRTFTSLVDAKLAKSKLDAYKITSWLDSENTASLNWFYIGAIGGIKLRVEQEKADEALKILGDEDKKESTGPRTIFTRYKYNTKRIAWITIIALLLGLIFFSLL